MEKKVYLIYRSFRGAKDVVCVTETEEHARYWIEEAYKVFSDLDYKFNFSAVPFVVDVWCDRMPKAL